MKTLYAVDKIPVDKLPQITMVDISSHALEIAKKNVASLLPQQEIIKKFNFVRSNLFQAVDDKFDLILTNPPYIPSNMVDELLADGRGEPRLALDGDMVIESLEGDEFNTDGTSIIKQLILQSCEYLNFNATILMETGEYNALKTAEFAQTQGFSTQIHTDLAGEYRNVEMSL